MKTVIDFANAGCAANQQEAQEKRLKSTFALVCNNSDTDDLSSYMSMVKMLISSGLEWVWDGKAENSYNVSSAFWLLR